MWPTLVPPSCIPPTLSLLDASEPVRLGVMFAACAVVGSLAWITTAGRHDARVRRCARRPAFPTAGRRRHSAAHASPA